MKIEKISDNQIRCTLTKEDLASRQIRLTELVYGTEKTKALFQDMMQQAYYDCGFEVNNTPIMIEAIPMSAESIILVITKVDSPDELDSRFSRFSPEDESASQSEGFSSLGDILEFFSRLTQARRGSQGGANQVPCVPGQEGLDTVSEAKEGEGEVTEEQLYELTRFFLFRDLQTVIRAARSLEPFIGVSSLYKNQEDGNYYMLLQKAEAPADQYNRVCNTLSEYGLAVDYLPGIEQLFEEHMQTILKGQALQDLQQL